MNCDIHIPTSKAAEWHTDVEKEHISRGEIVARRSTEGFSVASAC